MIIKHQAPFDLRNQNGFFGGWPILKDTDQEFAVVMAFPVEGWQESAAVVVSQAKNGAVTAEAHGAKNSQQATAQALAALSLDVDDGDWEKVGDKDPIIKKLKTKYGYLRPVLFHSPYEAAAGFVIGQRISIKQRQAIQKNLADQYGAKITVEGQQFAAFPRPQIILDLKEFPGLNPTKLERLHGVAKAALDGNLDRAMLLKVAPEKALEQLLALNGIGPFYASGILYRGAGVVDDITDDDLTKYAVAQAYGLSANPTQAEVLKIAENWKPYRMWCEVLLHVWLRREIGLPKRK
jgi:DNA-3-methyladenine glycosylase II